MPKRETFAPCLAVAIVVAVSLNIVEGAEKRRGAAQGGVATVSLQPAAIPMPRLDPISHFVPPIDPWVAGGFGWQAEGLDDQGDPFCTTNRRPTPTCDPDGPRAFLHAGFDAAPAPDRVVRASAAGRVVVARKTTAFVTGLSEGEGGGIVVLEHDRDGDPSTGDDHVLTVYGHVDPEVTVGQIVAAGDRIALTSTTRGNHLHFGVRQGPFDPADLDLFRSFLPPPGTSGCVGCYSRPLPAPAFPDLWQDPQQLFAASPHWLAMYGGANESASDVLEMDDGFLAFGYAWNAPPAGGRSIVVRQLDRQGNLVSQRAYSSASTLNTIKHVERTQDGGVIALAISGSPIDSRPILIKFDSAGQLQWSREYGIEATAGTPHVRLWLDDIAVTADGGFIATGTAQISSNVNASIAVARLDSAGNVQWIRTYDPLLDQRGTFGARIAPTPDGGFVIAAEYQSNPTFFLTTDLLVLRINAAGEVLWGTNLGNGQSDARAGRIAATPDGGAVVAAYRTSAGIFLPSEIWVVKLNGDGAIAWSSLYGSASGNGLLEENGTALTPTRDGGYLVGGHRTDYISDPFGPDTDLLLMKLDGAGEVVGQRRLDSLGRYTTPLGLRATDNGFLLAGGVETDCRVCQFLFPDAAARFVVAHLDGALDCPGGCTAPYDLVRQPGLLAGGAVGFGVGALTGTWVDAQMTQADAIGERHLCNHGFFGCPPAIDPASLDAGPQTVSCDRTQFVEAFVCYLGAPGVQATAPVILKVTYDALSLKAHVVDGDSTPAQNDVASVTASLSFNQPPDPRAAIPMLDDGSLTAMPGLFNNDVTVCSDDPLAGLCSCGPQHLAAYSGDLAMGDDIYTLETSLSLPNESSLLDFGKGCIVENRPKSTLLYFPPGVSVDVLLRATDNIGNVTSTTQTFTPSAATVSCTGDACACCLLTSQDATACSGLPGLPSPDFPNGVCRSF